MWRDRQEGDPTDYRGKAGIDTTLGNGFSMNSQTTAFLKTGIHPTLINGCTEEVSCCASKDKAHPVRYHQGPPSGFLSRDSSNVPEAQQISPLSQIAVKLRCDSARRHVQRHLFLLNSWRSQRESKMEARKKQENGKKSGLSWARTTWMRNWISASEESDPVSWSHSHRNALRQEKMWAEVNSSPATGKHTSRM